MNKVKELTDIQFEKFKQKGVAVVDFWAPWCGPCRMIAPILEQLSTQLKSVRIGKVNVDDYRDLAKSLQISSIPNICIFKNGELVDRIIGVNTAESMIETISKHL